MYFHSRCVVCCNLFVNVSVQNLYQCVVVLPITCYQICARTHRTTSAFYINVIIIVSLFSRSSSVCLAKCSNVSEPETVLAFRVLLLVLQQTVSVGVQATVLRKTVQCTYRKKNMTNTQSTPQPPTHRFVAISSRSHGSHIQIQTNTHTRTSTQNIHRLIIPRLSDKYCLYM